MINVNDKVAWGIREIENKIAQAITEGKNAILFDMDEYMKGDNVEQIADKMVLEISSAGFTWSWTSESNYYILIKW